MSKEINVKIDECIAEIDPFKSLAPSMVKPVIKNLSELKTLIDNLNAEYKEKALNIISNLKSQMGVYAAFIPKTSNNLIAVKQWLDNIEN